MTPPGLHPQSSHFRGKHGRRFWEKVEHIWAFPDTAKSKETETEQNTLQTSLINLWGRSSHYSCVVILDMQGISFYFSGVILDMQGISISVVSS